MGPGFESLKVHQQSVLITHRVHPSPFRTRKLSYAVPKILDGKLSGKIGRGQHKRGSGDNTGPSHIFLLSSVGRANISLCTHELMWETHKFGTDFCAVPPHSSLAQSVERVTVNHDVVGSSPTGGAKNTPKIDVFGVFSSVKTKK